MLVIMSLFFDNLFQTIFWFYYIVSLLEMTVIDSIYAVCHLSCKNKFI